MVAGYVGRPVFTAVVLPEPGGEGRWCLCRYSPAVGATAETSYPTRELAVRALPALQRQFDADVTPAPSIDPWEPRQIAFGFYTDADASY